jgi:peptidoglycan-associated lipoprotein
LGMLKGRFFGVLFGLLLVAGCATESTKNPDTASSLDAHRAGKSPPSGALKDIAFAFDSYDLSSEARSILQANARWLKANPAVNVEVEGHCDERGATDYNLALGAKRARAAMDYLVSLGVSQARIKTTSYGEELPMCKEAAESCYEKNRRDRLVDIRARPSS